MTAVARNMTFGAGSRKRNAPTIAAGVARALVEFAEGRGASPEALMQRAGLAPGDLEDPDDRIPLASHVALLDAAADLSGDPALALRFGKAVSMPDLSIVGLICQSARSAFEAFEQLNRYVRLIIDADKSGVRDWFELERTDDGLWALLTSPVYVEHPRLAESALARSLAGTDYLGRSFVKAVHFTHAAPDYAAEYERIFKAPVVFGSDRNAALIDEELMSVEFASSNRYLFGVLTERADSLLRGLENTKTMCGRVESVLLPILHTGGVKMERVARDLGLSRRTLYRQLKAEGLNYGKLLDDLRRRMALDYLGGGKASVTETAYLVGFSDQSAFSRAFRRWTAMSPRSYKSENA